MIDLMKLEKTDLELEMDEHGTTPLVWAASEGNLEMTKFLVDLGANLESSDHYGTTALMAAAEQGRFDVARYLVSQGASRTIIDSRGFTALDCAVSRVEDLLE